jgi:hypothetical protein
MDEQKTEIMIGNEDPQGCTRYYSGNAEISYKGKKYEIEYGLIVYDNDDWKGSTRREFDCQSLTNENDKEVEEPLRTEIFEEFKEGYDEADADGQTPE